MGGCQDPERRWRAPRVSGTAGLGTGVLVSALALDPNQVLRRGWSPPKSPSEVFLSLWTVRESCPQGAAMEPPPRPLSRSHSHHCSRPASCGSQQGGRAPQGARSPFRGPIRAGGGSLLCRGAVQCPAWKSQTQTHGGKGPRVPVVSGEPSPCPPPRAQSESSGTALAWGLDALTGQAEHGALSGPVHLSSRGTSSSPALWSTRYDLPSPQGSGPGPCPSPPPILTTLSSRPPRHPAYVTGP